MTRTNKHTPPAPTAPPEPIVYGKALRIVRACIAREVSLPKLAHECSWFEVDAAVAAAGEVGALSAFHEQHFRAVKAAVDAGLIVSDEVLYNHPFAVRSDLSADDMDEAVSSAWSVGYAMQSKARAVQALREWTPGIARAGRCPPHWLAMVEQPIMGLQP